MQLCYGTMHLSNKKKVSNMKKLFAWVFLIFLLISCSTSLADTVVESPVILYGSSFKNLDGYEYDRFDDKWNYTKQYIERYSDAIVTISLGFSGDETGPSYPPAFFVAILDTNWEPLYTVTAIDLIIDDTRYSFKSVLESDGVSMVFLGPKGKQLVEAFAVCQNVAIRLTYGYHSVSFDMDQDQVEMTLKDISIHLWENNVWDYMEDFYSVLVNFEAEYPLTIK